MADQQQTEAHGDHGPYREPDAPVAPDESKLWDDEAHAAVANDVARMWFTVTTLGALVYIAVVIIWIFL